MPRLLPDADALILALIRPALTGVDVATELPDDLGGRVPFVVAQRVSGAAIHPRFLDRPTFNVDAWHTTRTAAADLAESVRVALVDAVEQQIVTEHGHVVNLDEQSGPAYLRTAEQPDTLHRFQAMYSLATRPPRR